MGAVPNRLSDKHERTKEAPRSPRRMDGGETDGMALTLRGRLSYRARHGQAIV